MKEDDNEMVSFLAQLMQPLKTGKWSQFLLGGGSPVPEPMPSVCVSLKSIQPHLSLSDKHYICHSGGKGVESFSVFPRARTQTQWSLDTNSCPLPNRCAFCSTPMSALLNSGPNTSLVLGLLHTEPTQQPQRSELELVFI